MAIVAKRSTMNLFSDRTDPYSHQVRLVLAEKGVNVEITHVNPDDKPEDLLDVNPYGNTPTLIDRELVLYHASIIMEYLDERFPHPPLLPVYPVARAESRKMMVRIENDWYTLMHTITESDNDVEVEEARTHLRDSLISMEPVFESKPYFMSEDFTLVDCYLAPLLWRLHQLGIEIPAHAKSLHAYMERVFARKSFQASLTEIERELRAA